MEKGPISQFITHHYRHFNAAALIDAAKGYEAHMQAGGKMMITLGGAMSTAELGISLAEMIRQDKVQIITCTGANLEEDIMNLVAHSPRCRACVFRCSFSGKASSSRSPTVCGRGLTEASWLRQHRSFFYGIR